MALRGGFIKIDRSILEWEWYRKPKTVKVFLHLLLSANIAPAHFEGISISRGQVVTSIKHIAEENGLTEKEVRTAIKHLERANTVARQSTSKFTIFTILNYDKYQGRANDRANKGQAEGKPKANEGQQNNKEKNNKQDNLSFSSENKFDYGALAITGGNY